MALRLVERGVRMVQVYFGNGQPWDNHDDILIHQKLAAEADPADRRADGGPETRGLLQETLVMIGGEFGRTPAVEVSGLVKVQNGRDHNSHGFTCCSPAAESKAAWRTARPTISDSRPSTSRSTVTICTPLCCTCSARPHEAHLSLQRPRFPADGRQRAGDQGNSCLRRQVSLHSPDDRPAWGAGQVRYVGPSRIQNLSHLCHQGVR